MSTHRISLDVSQNGQSVLNDINAIANESDSFVRLGNYIQKLASGERRGKIRFNANAVQATGTVAFSSFIADDTVTVNGNVFTGKASPSGANQFAIGSTDEDCANNLAAKINASALDLMVGCVGAMRRGTIALSSFVTTDYITINGVVFTGKTSPADGNKFEFAIGLTDSSTAENAMNAINASLHPALAGLTVTRSSATLTFNFLGTLTLAISAHGTATSKTVVAYSLIPGQIGNLCSLAISAHGSVSGALLTGGTEGTQVIFSKNYTTV